MVQFNRDELFLVTGGSSGLGKVISHRINELGGSIISIGRNPDRLNLSKHTSTNPDYYNIEVKDLTEDIDSLPEWLTSLALKYGKIKGMCLSHGIMYMLPIQAEKIEKSIKLFNTNFFSYLSLIKGYQKKSVNTGKGSSIVCISSFTSQLGIPSTSSYSASKAALNSLVRTAANELARSGTRINAILAGHILTELLTAGTNALSSEMIEKLKSKYPLGLGEPLDVANAVCFLLSEAARWITGSSLVIDGGASINF